MEKHRKNIIGQRAIWFSVAVDIIILDQLSKWAVTEMFLRPEINGEKGINLFDWYQSPPSMMGYAHIQITSFFNIVMAWNTGVSFSLFSNYGAYMPSILIIVALGIVALFSVWLWRAENHIYGICYALIIGGALGNVIDRARFGAVIDFLDFHVMGYHWPAFNVADMAVVIGVGLLMVVSFFFDVQDKEQYGRRHE